MSYDYKTPQYRAYVSEQLTYDAEIIAGTATSDEAARTETARLAAVHAALHPVHATTCQECATWELGNLPEYTVTETRYYRVNARNADEAERTYLTAGKLVDQDRPRATVED